MTCKNNKIIYLKGFYFFRCTSFWFYINKIVMSINHSSTSFNFCNAITKIKIQNFMYYFIDIWSKTYIIPNISFWFCNTAFLFRRVLMDEEKQRRPPDSCPIIFDSWYGEFHLKTYPMQCSQICFAPNFKWAVTLSGSSFYILPRATLGVSTKMHFHPIIMNVPLDLLVFNCLSPPPLTEWGILYKVWSFAKLSFKFLKSHQYPKCTCVLSDGCDPIRELIREFSQVTRFVFVKSIEQNQFPFKA